MVNIHVNISFVKGALYDFTILATEAQENRIHFATLPSQSMIVNTGIAYRMFLIYLSVFVILFCLSGGWHVNARLVWVSCTSTCCYQVSHVSIAPCEQCVTCLKTNIMNLHCYSELYLTNKYMYLNMDFHNKIWMVHTIKNINHKFQNADIITDLEVTKLEPLLYTCWHT